ncbi:MAG TPA: hypothetical protein DCG75_08845 [Bacteroidales bacterium]|jgi:hypothetical protein|nr:hypothetical protein [Bacteroidales bacterium]
MKGLNIPATDKSPKVLFDYENYLFEMQGNSRPENVRDFYFPIIYKIRKHFEKIINKNQIEEFNEKSFKFNFKLDYFNSSSAKFISDILVLIKDFTDAGLNFKVYWYFTDGDEDMKEVGEDFSEMISFPFHFIMVER